MQTEKPQSLILCAISAVAFLLGFYVAVLSFRYELQIDHDSGLMRNVMAIGPFTVRSEDHSANYLGLLKLDSGTNGVSGIPNWKVAARFHSDSKMSASSLEAILANQLIILDTFLRAVPVRKSREVKTAFLTKLHAQGTESAISFLNSIQTDLLDEIEKDKGLNHR